MSGKSSQQGQLAVLLFLVVQATTTVHRVDVGNGGFKYSPNVTYAASGDIVQFFFYPPDHSVIRSKYVGDSDSNPCVPNELYYPGTKNTFFSGLINVTDADITDPPSWNISINNTQPIWFYCNAVNSCSPNGMVGAINPYKTQSIEKQFEAAKASNYQLNPGDSFPAEGVTPTATGTVVPAPGVSANSGSSNSSGGSRKLSSGAIAGVVIGGVAFLAACGTAFYFWGRSRTFGQIFASQTSTHAGDDTGTNLGGGVGKWIAGQQAQYDAKHNSMTTAPTSTGSPTMVSPKMQHDIEAAPSGSHFVGYNRQSGEPDYAFEAPIEGAVVSELGHEQNQLGIQPVQEEKHNGSIEMPG